MHEQTLDEMQVLKEAYAGSQDGWYEWIVSSGKINVSSRWLEMMGLENQTRVETFELWSGMIFPEDRDELLQHLQDHLSGKTQSFMAVYRLKNNHGKLLWIYDKAKITEYDKEGHPVRMTGLISDVTVFRNVAVELAESKKDLEYKIAFEELINRISSGFINISVDKIDKAINESLHVIGEFIGADRSYIFHINNEQETLSNTYEWCAPGISSQINNLQALQLADIKPWLEILSDNRAINIPVVSEMPDKEAGLRESLEVQSIKSMIAVPMFNGQELVGIVGLDAVTKAQEWNEADEQVLRAVSNTYLNVLRLKEVQQELTKYRDHLQEIIKEKKLEIKQKEAESFKNERLRALGTLASGIAHDFNNILQVIQSYTELIEMTHKSGPVNEEYIKQVLDASKKGKKLIESILTFSKQETKPIEIVDIANVTTQTLQTIMPVYQKRININAGIEDCGKIPLNSIQYQHILINLIDNASDASATGKDVDIRLERKKIKNDSNTRTTEVVELSVTDKGKGMTQDELNRLFEPFFTTKPVGEGTGLGMPMVKGMVDNHRGKIYIESTPGKGTTITIHFPVN